MFSEKVGVVIGLFRKTGIDPRDDRGVALTTVVVASSVLFMLATALITYVTLNANQDRAYVARNKALHMADAGLNAYLYELRRDPEFYLSTTTIGPTSLADGSWIVTATPPTGGEPLTLRARGTVPGGNGLPSVTRAVVAKVAFPSYAQYVFATNGYLYLGSGGTVYGRVICNDYIRNDGRITGFATSGQDCYGSGTWEGLPSPGYKEFAGTPLNWGGLTTDFNKLQVMAQSSSTYYTAVNSPRGLKLTLNSNDTVTVEKVTAGGYALTDVSSPAMGGAITSTAYQTIAVPESGVLYFQDPVYVQGTYGGGSRTSNGLTIVSDQVICVNGNIAAADPNGKDTLGLVSKRDVLVGCALPGFPNDVTIQAAMLAQGTYPSTEGRVYGDTWTAQQKNSLTIKGGFTYLQQGGFANGTETQGFATRSYNYDARLDKYPPPGYPILRNGNMNVDSWVEQGRDGR